jgi:hypothetical protein
LQIYTTDSGLQEMSNFMIHERYSIYFFLAEQKVRYS